MCCPVASTLLTVDSTTDFGHFLYHAVFYLLYVQSLQYQADGILLKLHRILIPHTLHMEMLALIHEGHQVIKKCLLCSRESLFWPGITNEICQTINKMFDMPIYFYSTKETSQCSKWNSTTCITHSRNQFVLLEELRSFSYRQSLLKILNHKKTSIFNRNCSM